MPVKRYSGTVHYAKDAVLQFPEHAALIGAICTEWSRLEAALAWFFTILVLGERTISDGSEEYIIGAFEQVSSLSTKRSMLLDAADRRLGGVAKKQLNAILHDVQQAGESRHKIAHGRWAISNDHPAKLVWAKREGDALRFAYEIGDLREKLDEIGLAHDQVQAFFDRGDIRQALLDVGREFSRRLLAAQNP